MSASTGIMVNADGNEQLDVPVDDKLQVGMEVAVIHEVWPHHACSEMGGRAWRAKATEDTLP